MFADAPAIHFFYCGMCMHTDYVVVRVFALLRGTIAVNLLQQNVLPDDGGGCLPDDAEWRPMFSLKSIPSWASPSHVLLHALPCVLLMLVHPPPPPLPYRPTLNGFADAMHHRPCRAFCPSYSWGYPVPLPWRSAVRCKSSLRLRCRCRCATPFFSLDYFAATREEDEGTLFATNVLICLPP